MTDDGTKAGEPDPGAAAEALAALASQTHPQNPRGAAVALLIAAARLGLAGGIGRHDFISYAGIAHGGAVSEADDRHDKRSEQSRRVSAALDAATCVHCHRFRYEPHQGHTFEPKGELGDA